MTKSFDIGSYTVSVYPLSEGVRLQLARNPNRPIPDDNVYLGSHFTKDGSKFWLTTTAVPESTVAHIDGIVVTETATLAILRQALAQFRAKK